MMTKRVIENEEREAYGSREVLVPVLVGAIRLAAEGLLAPSSDIGVLGIVQPDDHCGCGRYPTKWRLVSMADSVKEGWDRVHGGSF